MAKESLLARLKALSDSGVIPMHMPGHKRNAALAGYLDTLGARLDITEITGFDDLHDPEGILRDAQDRAARLWKVRKSWFWSTALREAFWQGSGRWPRREAGFWWHETATDRYTTRWILAALIRCFLGRSRFRDGVFPALSTPRPWRRRSPAIRMRSFWS